jgi:hypothetical protein
MSTMAGALASLGGGVASGIALGLTDQVKLKRGSMMGIDPEDGSEVLPEHAFQWMPETLTDAIEIGWEPKQVPGMSHALMQWGQNGGRTFSFEVVFYRHMQVADKQPGVAFLSENPDSDENRKYNPNIEYMVSWLRAFCYPTYVDGGDFRRPKSPPICILNLPNVALNEDGTDIVFCVMTQCDVTYEKLFPNGAPRVVRVSLALKQVVQDPRAGANPYRFKGQAELAAARERFSEVAKFGKPVNQRESDVIDDASP